MYKLMPGRFNDRAGAIVVGWAEVTVANARLGIPTANVADTPGVGRKASLLEHIVHVADLADVPTADITNALSLILT